jgi:hypothetical protein
MLFPLNKARPGWRQKWALDAMSVFRSRAARKKIDTAAGRNRSSNQVLEVVSSGLVRKGYEVEGKSENRDKSGHIILRYQYGAKTDDYMEYYPDALHRRLGIVLEIEAGQAMENYHVLRNLVRIALTDEASYAIIAVPQYYPTKRKTTTPYEDSLKWYRAVFHSNNLRTRLKGVLLIGY